MTTHREVERKYEPTDPAAPVPDLVGVGPVVEVVALGTTELDATYFDTRSLALARHHITLRRRTGGEDEGWHLKRPQAGDARSEERLPLAASESVVPPELVNPVRGIVRDQVLVPVAVVRTTRLESRLLDQRGRPLAVVADDVVRAQHFDAGGHEDRTWREVEVELIEGDGSVLDAVEEAFSAAGLHRSASASKLQRALGRSLPSKPRSPGRHATVGEVLQAHLRTHVERLEGVDPAVRADEPDAVHQMRVATRRLRSALATYRPILDRRRTDPIRDELKWLGRRLGAPRDAEVQRERLAALLDDQPGDLILGPVRTRLSVELQERHRAAHAKLVEALDGERYLRLLDALDALVAEPPFRARADRPAGKALPRLVRRATRRMDRALEAVPAGPAGDRDRALHAVRKAAKRARYAAQSAQPVVGRPAKRLAQRMEAVQEVLGEHQDAVEAARTLRSIGVAAHLAHENGFTFGLLHGLEQGRAAEAEAEADAAIAAASTPKVRGWLEH